MGDLLERLRPVRDDDGDALVALIGGVYAEYPGCVLDLAGVDADLRAKASHVAELGGRFWVLDASSPAAGSGDHGDGLAACVGWVPRVVDGEPGAELIRLYVARPARRQGLGAALVGHVEATAAGQGRRLIELWSDTRFADAHRLYERCGYQRQRGTRALHDPSNTTEYRYLKRWSPAGRRG